jgi:hypothetical protein
LDKINLKPGAIGQKFSITPRRGFSVKNTKKDNAHRLFKRAADGRTITPSGRCKQDLSG